ncbi:hypothetical protein BASA81_005566 [Batrachochytrium salamandrivorans]|nr:hypothetical protein BASA81_005566 [Batrachochytrium salamandrivorans]
MLSFALFVLLLVGLADLATAKRLAGEGRHYLVLQHNGQVFGVGFNNYGQLGLGTTSDAVVLPQAMLSVTNASDVSAGWFHSCLIDHDSKVKCVGYNDNRQLGDGTDTASYVLVPTLGLDSDIEEVYCGFLSSCAITTSGKAQCWGYFDPVTRYSPVNITLPGGIQSVSLGYFHACLVEIGGKLYCMGSNEYGQLGMENTTTQEAPIQVVGLAAENIVSVACVQVTGITSGVASAWTGWHNSFALMRNGTVWAFGMDNYGVFGTESADSQLEPIVFGLGVSGVVEIRGGYETTCILLQDNTVWCTGENFYGQLGVGDTTVSYALVQMRLPSSAPTAEPTLVPTTEPTVAPTQEPTLEPTLAPTSTPTFEPTVQPTMAPAVESTQEPTLALTSEPITESTAEPTLVPTVVPTFEPTLVPTAEPTLAPASEPTVEPTLVPTNEPTVEPTSEPAATVAPTTMPTPEPIQSPVEPPTVPANSVCFPRIGTDKAECATLMKTCAKSDVAMFWAGAGCRVNGMVQNDGGCQCKDYCGYTCSKACNLSSGGRCKWNNNLKACTVAATGKAYVPRDSKYCPAN